MKNWLFILLLFPFSCAAQVYKYISIEDGLSNRRVYSIQKDRKGYMWFLTHDGIDRFDGKHFKQYKLTDGNEEVNSLLNLNWLYIDTEGILWEIGKKGKIYRYDEMHDTFKLIYKLPISGNKDMPAPVNYSFIDNNHTIWLCCESNLYLYNTQSNEVTEVDNAINENITDIAQIDDTHYFIGTEKGIHYAELKNGALSLIHCDKLDNITVQVNKLYFDPQIHKLFIGTFQKGIYVYDMNTKMCIQPQVSLTDISINTIKPLDNKTLLIATDGAGVFKMDLDSYLASPYIIAEYNKYNAMNGNSINDIFVDEEERIWLANYPIGITVRNNRFSSYNWIKHSVGNHQSLINDQVNCIIEDSEGDLWFATNNGVSLYFSQTGQWHSFLSSFESTSNDKNHIFTTLCEVVPGVIWTGGYSSGLYQINKKNLSVEYFTPSLFSHLNIRPDKYIRTIMKDSHDKIWSGGYYNLKLIDIPKKTIRLYNGLNSITAIVEKDNDHMWIGTATGLFLLDKETGGFERIKLPVESNYIYSIYQTQKGNLYIGTSGSGLLIYDPKTKLFTHYHTENCALISNNIYTILSDNQEYIYLSTENGLTCYSPSLKTFHNWTKEQGLMTIHFNASSGTLRSNNCFLFGSSNGAVEFHKDTKIPRTYSSKMVFSDFNLFYQTVYPGDDNSPLETDIDNTKTLYLKYSQNIFSIKVSSINYDYPSNILYSYKMEGFYDEWSMPENENTIRFTNLSPGDYVLHVRAISNEDKNIVLEEREMKIVIAQPAWLSLWALILYAIGAGFIGIGIIRFMVLRKQRKISDDKIHFFINTAHDIRTPLTLIQAPLEELREKEQLSKDGITNTNTALRNVNALLRLTTNLINFERADVYSSELYISEYELNTYLWETFNTFRPYAAVKHINFTYECNFRYLNVWFDKEKMDSILKNIISNALKYTPANGSVHIFAADSPEAWSVEVKDTGIGIPANEQKKLFKIHFRGTNAINSKLSGSGIGLMLVWKLVQLHNGKVHLNSIEHQGSVIKISFPKDNKQFRKAHLITKTLDIVQDVQATYTTSSYPDIYEKALIQHNNSFQRLLIVEDNDDLRHYLGNSLSNMYTIQMCSNGKEALTIIDEYKPELIISDIMMPEMCGDELCRIIKNNIETSHIPIILLTAMDDERNIMEGLRTGADEYIVKPFNIGILKATIINMLSNRTLLRNKYSNCNTEKKKYNIHINCSSDIDWQFIAKVNKKIEDNMDNQDLTVEMLSSLLNMSRTSFYNKIKALTTQAPGDYIRLIRLERAAQLLREGEHSVTEIAEMTGFNDAKYFREVFRKHYNASPTRYVHQENEVKDESVS